MTHPVTVYRSRCLYYESLSFDFKICKLSVKLSPVLEILKINRVNIFAQYAFNGNILFVVLFVIWTEGLCLFCNIYVAGGGRVNDTVPE